jgi:arsenate reductase-like glutaredoxin family protein
MEDNGIEIAEQIPASRKLGEDTARELIAAADAIYIAKGKKVDAFTREDTADDIVVKMLGSTGSLRAPTIVVGPKLLVGFNEETYQEVLGREVSGTE